MLTVPLNLWNWPNYKFMLYRVKFYKSRLSYQELAYNPYGNSYLEFREENSDIVEEKIADLKQQGSDVLPNSFDYYIIEEVTD
jgi:hypothetical protein